MSKNFPCQQKNSHVKEKFPSRNPHVQKFPIPIKELTCQRKIPKPQPTCPKISPANKKPMSKNSHKTHMTKNCSPPKIMRQKVNAPPKKKKKEKEKKKKTMPHHNKNQCPTKNITIIKNFHMSIHNYQNFFFLHNHAPKIPT